MPLKLIPPSKIKGATSYYIRGTYLGVSVYRSARSGKSTIAGRELKRIEREIEEGRYASPASVAPDSFADAALGYLKTCRASEVRRVKRLVEFFGETALSDFDKDRIDQGEEHFYPGGLARWAASTLNREYRTPVAAVLHHAADRQLMPWLKVFKHKERQRTRWLEPERAAALIAAAADVDAQALTNKKRVQGTHLMPLLVTLLSTGLRISEACGITWAQVNLARREFGPLMTKNGEEYVIHMGPVAFEAIANLPEFLPNGERDPSRKIFGFRDRHAVKYPLSLACEKAGMVKYEANGEVSRTDTGGGRNRKGRGRAKTTFSPHMARHSFATWLRRQQGMDLKMLMELGRWKSAQSVMRYAHVSADEHAASISRLPLALKA